MAGFWQSSTEFHKGMVGRMGKGNDWALLYTMNAGKVPMIFFFFFFFFVCVGVGLGVCCLVAMIYRHRKLQFKYAAANATYKQSEKTAGHRALID